MSPPTNTRSIWMGVGTYLLLSYALAWAIELGPVRHLSAGRPLVEAMAARPVITLLLVLVMYAPTVAALVARLRVERSGLADAGLRVGPLGYYAAAVLIPVGISVLAGVLSVLLGQARFDPHGTGMIELARRLNTARPVHVPPPAVRWIILPLAIMTAGVATTSLATFGEEFGWRGYLQVRLTRLGSLPAVVLTGVAWGLWHAPVILAGWNYPTHPYWGVPLMVAACVAWSGIFGWLRERSGSVFPAVVGHAALNSPAALAMLFYFRDFDTAIGMMLGVIGITITGVVALALWRLRPPRGNAAKPGHQPPAGGL